MRTHCSQVILLKVPKWVAEEGQDGHPIISYEIGKKVEAQPVGRAYILYIHAGILDLLLKDCTAEENLDFSFEFFRVGWE